MFLNEFHQPNDVVDRRLLKDSVSDIKNVARPVGRCIQDPLCMLGDYGGAAQQYAWVEIALDGMSISDPFPSGVQRYSPIDTNDGPLIATQHR